MSEQIKTVVAMLQKEINALREQIEKLNKENKHLKLENRRFRLRLTCDKSCVCYVVMLRCCKDVVVLRC